MGWVLWQAYLGKDKDITNNFIRQNVYDYSLDYKVLSCLDIIKHIICVSPCKVETSQHTHTSHIQFYRNCASMFQFDTYHITLSTCPIVRTILLSATVFFSLNIFTLIFVHICYPTNIWKIVLILPFNILKKVLFRRSKFFTFSAWFTQKNSFVQSWQCTAKHKKINLLLPHSRK